MQTAAVNVGNYSFFRQAFCTPLNATGASAHLELASDDVSTIFLNGEYLGVKVGAGAAASFDGGGGIQAGINILAVQLLSNRHGGHRLFNGGDHSGLLYNLNAQFSGLRPFASAPGRVLAGQSVQFSVDELALGGLPAYSYRIDYGDSTSAPYQPGKTFTHLYSIPGVYTATLTARDQYGCTASDLLPVTVLEVSDNLLVNSASVAYQDANGAAYSGLSGVGLELKPAADLAIVKTVQSGGVTPGQTVTYKLVVTNNGPDAVSGAVVTDTLPAALSGVTWTCAVTAGSCAHASGSGSALLEAVSLPSGASATYLIQAAINPAAAGSLVNRASVTAPASTTDLAPDNNLATVSSTLAPQAALTVSKTSDPLTGFAPGGSLTYLIQVRNPAGPSDAASVAVTDLFPAEVNGVTWTCAASPGSACTASGAGDINDTAVLKLGGAVTYTARAVVNLGLTAHTLVTNTASAVFGTGLPITATIQGLVIMPATLTATKEALNSSSAVTHSEPFIDADGNGGISPGDTLKYKVVITTDANDAYNVHYTDIPSSNTSLIVGSVVCDPACTAIEHGNTSGDTTVGISLDEIFANGSVSVYYQVLVKTGLPFQPGSITNQGLVSSSNADSLPSDDPSTVEPGDATVLSLSTGSIGGTAWRDANDNGVQEISETLMGDVNVSLHYQGLDGLWGTGDDQFLYVLTDSNGAYRFDALQAAPGYKYRIGFSLPTGFVFSPLQGDNRIDPATGLSAEMVLTPNESKSNIHAGLVSQTVITLIKFIDHDADGVFDADDTLAPPSTPFELCAKGPLALDYTCGLTDADSQVVFTAVPEGNYTFNESGQASWSQITPITPTFQANVTADPFTLYIGNAHADLECLGAISTTWPQTGQIKYTINFKKWFEDASANPSVAMYFEWTDGTGSLSYLSHSGTFTSTNTGAGTSGDPYVFRMNDIVTETTGSLDVIIQLDNPPSPYAVLTTYATVSSTFEPTMSGSKNNICGADIQYFGPTMLKTEAFSAYPRDDSILLTWWKKIWESFGKMMVIR